MPCGDSRRGSVPLYKGAVLSTVIASVIISAVAALVSKQGRTEASWWACRLPYMSPVYYPVAAGEHSRYGLYLYREGGVDFSTAEGHPVVFIPGNAGDYKQARSIAASAASQFHEEKQSAWRKPLDFFTVDFREDFSAFHAATLNEQGRYVASVIPRILDSYAHLPASKRPSSVTLVGHSMGGVVARLAATLTSNLTIDAIITMSTPHTQAPAALEYGLDRIYQTIGRSNHQAPAPILISICGGIADTQIVSDSCALPSAIIQQEDGFSVFSTAIPGAWTGVEHQAMVWCDQVRWRLARALLDMSTAGRHDKLDKARRWLIGPPHTSQRSPSGPHQERTQVRAQNNGTTVIIHHPAISDESLHNPDVGVEYCAREGHCTSEFYLDIIPWTSPAIYFPQAREGANPRDAAIAIDIEGDGGWINVDAPKGAALVTGIYSKYAATRNQWIQLGADNVHSSISFSNVLVSSLLSWHLETRMSACSGMVPIIKHTCQTLPSMPDLTVESRYFLARNGSVPLHCHISGAPFGDRPHTWGVSVDIYQQSSCPVQHVRLTLDYEGTFARVILRFRTTALACCVAWILLIIARQLHDCSQGLMPTISMAAEQLIRRASVPVTVFLGVSLAVQHIFGLGHLFFGYTHIFFLPLSYIAAVWSLGFVCLSAYSQVGISCAVRSVWRRHPSNLPEEAKENESLRLLSRVTAGLLLVLLVATSIPYRLALLSLYLVHIAVLLRTSSEREPSRRRLMASSIFLATFLLPLHAPTVAVWGRYLWSGGSHIFGTDHAILPVLPYLVFVLISSLGRPLRHTARTTTLIARVFGILSIIALAVGPKRPYLLQVLGNVGYILLACILW